MVKDTVLSRPGITEVLWLFLVWLLLLPWHPLPPTSPMACKLLPLPLWVWYLLVLRHQCNYHGHTTTLSLSLTLTPMACHLSINLSIYLSTNPSTYLPFYLSVYFSFYLSVCGTVYLFGCLWIIQTILHIQTLSFLLCLCHTYCHCTSPSSLPPFLNGAMVPTVVQLWYYMQCRILTCTSQKDVSFSAYLSVEFGTTHVLGCLSTQQQHHPKKRAKFVTGTHTALSYPRVLE